MAKIHPGDSVCLTFTGTLDNGDTFITVSEEDPMWVTIGDNQLPPSLELTVIEMAVGESRKIRVPPEEGYGQRQKDLLQIIDNRQMVEKLQPRPGMILSLRVTRDGVEQQVPATVMAVAGSEVTVDYNHPLAGHHLSYAVRIVDVRPAAPLPPSS